MSSAPPATDPAPPEPAPEAPRSPEDAAPELPGASALEDRLPEWFRSTKALPLLILPLGLILLYLGSMPLWHTDLWGHLAYGRLIWQQGSIPATEPFMPLARGVELIDTAWLSQVVGYLTMERFGVPGLQFLAASLVTFTCGVLAWLGYRKTDAVGWAVLGIAAYLWLNYKQLFNGTDMSVVIRPQMAGIAAFAVTLAVVVGRPSRWHWLVVPVTFALWANLHGSFLAGLALLGVFALGRGGDVLRRTDKFAAVASDWPFLRLILLTQLAAAAVLLNPYGLRVYADTWLFLKNPNLQDLPEWDPLTLRMFQGQAAAGVSLALLFLYRMTPRRIGTGEVLALILFGGSMLWTSRMIVWWAPIAAYFLTIHAAAVRRSFQKPTPAVAVEEAEPAVPARRSLWTVVSLFLIWIFAGLTPFAQTLLHGRNERERPAVSNQTPLGAAQHLAKTPPTGQVFNTYEFGDYLIWSSQKDRGLPTIRTFVASHAHLVPPDVWRAYVDTVTGSVGWENTLDRYGVTTIVLDKPARQTFVDRLREEPVWENTYEDEVSAVYRRRNPIR